MNRAFYRVAFIATLLALLVIQLGAYTRLKDGGLGCPDWPGCYGQIAVPQTQPDIAHAAKLFPTQPVEPNKAWLEMIHRYFAGSLAVLIFVLIGWSFIRKMFHKNQSIIIPLLLLGLVIFQALLGMWTVTMKLLPLVVMGHLLGGMAIAGLLWTLALSSDKNFRAHPLQPSTARIRPWAILGLIILALQIFLGGWTSSNYAALICSHFPFCHGSFFPAMDFKQGFNFFNTIGVNYEGGVLDASARIAIQMMHRYGAFITAFYLSILALYLLISRHAADLKPLGWLILIMLAIQFTLGVLNVELLMPMPIALAHNGVAALLLLSVITLVYKLYAKPMEYSERVFQGSIK